MLSNAIQHLLITMILVYDHFKIFQTMLSRCFKITTIADVRPPLVSNSVQLNSHWITRLGFVYRCYSYGQVIEQRFFGRRDKRLDYRPLGVCYNRLLGSNSPLQFFTLISIFAASSKIKHQRNLSEI